LISVLTHRVRIANLPTPFRLGMLELANTAMGLNFPVTLDGKPTDAVFKAFATIPMLGIPAGGSNTPRFDEFELEKMILKEAEA
jgi:hypothetical protein